MADLKPDGVSGVEKVVYVLWRSPEQSVPEFSAQLRRPVADALSRRGARGVQVNIADEAVSSAVMRIVATRPPMEAVISVWVDTAIDAARRPLDDVLSAATARVEAYLVCESQPLRNTAHPAALGQRTAGFSNVAFLRRPATLAHEAWLDLWQNHHTWVAIDTQSTFGYVQNVVFRRLTPAAPPWEGIVEELFPEEAMADVQAMFDAADDHDKFVRNMTAMRQSTSRFGADAGLDVLPTSQYTITSPFVG